MSIVRRSDLLLALVALGAGVYFFASLDRLWPLVDVELTRPTSAILADGAGGLAEQGIDVSRHQGAAWVRVDANALDYLEASFGYEQTQRLIAQGLPVAQERVVFKRRGDARAVEAGLAAGGRLQSWDLELEEDDPGGSIGAEEARTRIRIALESGLGLDPGEWRERTAALQERPRRRDHTFVYERLWNEQPELRERLVATVGGERVVRIHREVVVPAPFRRQRRAGEAPGRALEAIGILFLAVAAGGAIWVFLTGLREGRVKLARATIPPLVVLLCLFGTYALQSSYLFRIWEPLWPRWVSVLQNLVWRTAWDAWMAVVLLAFVAAGDALDREGRGNTLWSFFRGRWSGAGVASASLRGFAVGLICGGVLAGSVAVLQLATGGHAALQPRGFFFYALNSASPFFSTLLFFLNVALLEELGYRFFAATWLLRLTGGRRWVAILAPAVLYGLTHTRLDFLPPAGPFWARPLALTAVGCVWGWAFLRWDALTVVLSHWTADLFIFNWPRLASGDPPVVASAVAAISVPLLPAVLAWLRRASRRRPPGAAC